jgi:hypothetical protein
MPQEHYLTLLANFLDLIVHQLDHLSKRFFSGGALLRIDISRLQEREEQFAGTTVVRIGSGKHYRHLEGLQHLHALTAHVIGRIIGQNHCVPSPAST